MQNESVKMSQCIFGRGGENQPAKIWARRQTGKVAKASIGNVFEVTGYFTILKYLFNRTPHEMEGILGLTPQKLSSGADSLFKSMICLATNSRRATLAPGPLVFLREIFTTWARIPSGISIRERVPRSVRARTLFSLTLDQILSTS
jgi:hypothetical protein